MYIWTIFRINFFLICCVKYSTCSMHSAGVYKSPGRLDVNLKALHNNFGSTSLNVSLNLRAFLRLE